VSEISVHARVKRIEQGRDDVLDV